jgi:hypothetical protein
MNVSAMQLTELLKPIEYLPVPQFNQGLSDWRNFTWLWMVW